MIIKEIKNLKELKESYDYPDTRLVFFYDNGDVLGSDSWDVYLDSDKVNLYDVLGSTIPCYFTKCKCYLMKEVD